MTITSKTKIFGLIGDPVSHSVSPLVHNPWFVQAGVDAIYVTLRLHSKTAAEDIRALWRAGLAGLNVTLPHKFAALEASVEASDQCRKIGAANTLIRTDEGWRADNTDAPGFLSALQTALGGQSLAEKRVVMIGAGGAARASVAALHQAGAELTIANRTISKAADLAVDLAPGSAVIGLEDLPDALSATEIAVNATSMGHGGEGVALPSGEGRLFYDLTYGDAAKSVLDIARENGWRTEDGLRMLVEQARISFNLWTGAEPDAEPALQICREALGL